MAARYILRLDDACSTMLQDTWNPIEEALDSLGIKPIVGIIPENRDPAMECSSEDPAFWNRARGWQQKGWAIALHGLHHVYHDIPAQAKALVPIHGKSEFVGLSLEVQRRMIRRAYAKFAAEQIRPTVFMAPSHTFDANTLEALLQETEIRIITDGHSLYPYTESGFTWVPQQLWRLRPMPFGIWTVALHPNTMTAKALETVMTDLKRYASRIVSLDALRLNDQRKLGGGDRLFRSAFMAALRLKQARQ